MHTEFSLKTIAAGKHLLLEKPITVALPEADRLIAAAKKQGVRFMVAHVLRYFPEFLLIKQLADKGDFGPVLAAHFKRIISRPAWWAPEDLQRTGGPAIDLHIHDANFIQYLFGLPRAVTSQGFVGRADTVEYQNTLYHYADGPQAISAEGGWLAQQGCPFEHGYDVYFEEATLKFNSSWGVPPQLLTKDGKVRKPRLPGPRRLRRRTAGGRRRRAPGARFDYPVRRGSARFPQIVSQGDPGGRERPQSAPLKI